MRILLDEDTPLQLLAVLRHLPPAQRLDHIRDLQWCGKKDRAVLADARTAGFHLLLTNDAKQLDDPDECAAIRKSGLHHVRYAQRHPGLKGLALAMGAVISSIPAVLEELAEANGQRLVLIRGLDPRGRFQIVDPSKSPPPYWR